MSEPDLAPIGDSQENASSTKRSQSDFPPAQSAIEGVSQPLPRRRRRWLRAVAVGVSLAALLVLGFPWLLGLPPVRRALAAQLSRETGVAIEFGGLSCGWFSPLVVSDLRVATATGEQLLEIKQFASQASFRQLATSRDKGVLVVSDPRLTLAGDENRLNLVEALEALRKVDPSRGLLSWIVSQEKELHVAIEIRNAQIWAQLPETPAGETPAASNVTGGRDQAETAHRGPDSRGPDSRSPDSRSPDSRSPDSRSPDSRGPGRSTPEGEGADQPAQAEAVARDISLVVRLDRESGREVLAIAGLNGPQLIQRARLTPAATQLGLQYIAPVLAQATSVSGQFSLRLEQCRIPLQDLDSAQLHGTLQVHDVQLGAKGPLVRQIVQVLTRLVALETPERVRLAHDSVVEFEAREGGIHHQGLAFGLPDVSEELVLQTRGTVKFDQTLDLTLDAPLPYHLLGDGPLLSKLGSGHLEIPVKGTLTEPRLALKGDGSLLRGALGGLADDPSGDGLQQLLQGSLAGARRLLGGEQRRPNPADPQGEPSEPSEPSEQAESGQDTSPPKADGQSSPPPKPGLGKRLLNRLRGNRSGEQAP